MVTYHNPYSCNRCGGTNSVDATSYDEVNMHECKTVCDSCGWEDYWAYGFFESSQHIESKCDKYSFGDQ